ncbi:MAG: UDP-N-acetylmuramoyl-L-alanyl-D-glutamate--2,6-diaminopimelate ligase [Lachnospiraceae bacterium]|nr:UDP-N-acetylmuramoyl-L-alanyl-D-glutamate--2,6-diaminopimelate ligase [Lachnospiraceae bacterium]
MNLVNLFEGLEYEIICGHIDVEINGISYNTKNIENGDVFVCIKGYEYDSHNAIEEIVSLGARVVVVESNSHIDKNVVMVKVADTKKALAIMSANYFHKPNEKLITIGITGTSGKTTTAYMIRELLEGVDVKTGLIGTVEIFDGLKSIPSVNTTPASYEIMHQMNEMVKNGCKAVVMEVSSQALKLDRVYGMKFDYGLFTNIYPDHIGKNEHDTFEEYISCKMKLVEMSRQIIVNIDDDILKTITMQPEVNISTISIENTADYRAKKIEYTRKEDELGMKYELCGRSVHIEMSGIFNVYNSLMAIATVNEIMKNTICSLSKIIKNISYIKVNGRMQLVHDTTGKTVIIDYAHNGISMEKLLIEISNYTHNRIIVIFGCGGNRAKGRRFDMGEVAAKYADIAIITSDNPRWEEPLDIIKDIETAFDEANDGMAIKIIEPDRRKAIKKALNLSNKEDLILLIGKGHETYQEIKGVKYPMSETTLITTC